jgi:ABC-type sugar transport system ATPase subunit
MNLLPASLLPAVRAAHPTSVDGATLGVRPHDLAVVAAGVGDTDALVDVVEPRGSELLLYLRLGASGDGPEIRAIVPPDLDVVPDRVVGLRLDRARLHFFEPDSGRRVS